MYYSAIGMLAAMVLVIENLDIILNRNKSFSLPSWRAYRKLLYAIFFYYACDICWGFVEKLKIATLLFADTSVYFISMALGLLCLTQYVVTYLDEDNAFSRFILYSGRVFLVVVATLVVVNIFHPILFTVDSKCVYRALGARYILLTSQILLLILMSVYSLTYIMRKNAPAEKRMRYRTLAAWLSSGTIPVWLRCSGVPTRTCTRTRRVSRLISGTISRTADGSRRSACPQAFRC